MKDFNITPPKSQVKALETLKSIPHWIFYKNEVKPGDDKPAKTPKNPHSGGNASSTKSATWGTFIDAVRANKRFGGDGLGWVFTEDVGIVGIDLDGCLDETGQVEKWARDIIEAIHSYTEISPSGRGLHIFARAKIKKALGPVPGGNLEMYSRARYFTVTGKMLPGSTDEMADRQEAISEIWQAENERRREKNKGPAIVKTSTPEPGGNDARLKAYTEKALLDEMATLSMATQGCRNDQLNRTAFNLGQFVGASLLGQTEIETTLLSIAMQLGLSQSEAEKTIQSGLSSGIASPRTNWPEPEVAPSPEVAVTTPELPPNDLIYHDAIKPHLDYINKMWGLSPGTVYDFKLGYCPHCPTSLYSASFTVPYYDSPGLVDLRHHLLSPNGQGAYRPEVESYPPHLFNAGAMTDDWAILVNREPNTMLLFSEYGLPAVGLPSTFRAEWLTTFDNLKKVFIALDPGQRGAAKRIGRLLARRGIDARISTLPFSPVDMLVRYGCSGYDFFKFIEQAWAA